ncbi:MAG: 30S ribosomal protein S4e [Sulfolobales archaeon]
MGRMGSSRHMKRHAAPTFWPLMRKEFKWAVKPSPGPHPINRSLPLLVVVRDLLKYVERAKEARRLIAEGHFKIDGIVRTDYKFPVGLMDVIEVVDTGEFFRVIPAPITYMTLIPIERSEGSFKLCRIEDKTTVKGGHIQLNLHDGRNILIRVSDPLKSEEDVYRTMGSLKITIPDQEIVKYLPLQNGSIVIITSGRSVGKVGRVVSVSEGMRRYRRVVKIESIKGGIMYTTLDKVFVIGVETPEIKLPKGVF